jgi:hypothetical protein
VSAGGTAAINALAAKPAAIARVVTVCTPYGRISTRSNSMLDESLDTVETSLLGMSASAKDCILSVHGMYDEVVSVGMSKPQGITQKTLFSIGHALTICLSMTVYGYVIRRFLIKVT